jgi:DNA-binding NtrC family response regulator
VVRGTVLIVDDDTELLELLGKRLSSRGFVVEQATRISEAKAHMEAHSLEAALVDLNLAEESGLDLLLELGKLSPSAGIVLMSGAASVPAAVEAMRRGALDFLEKPLDMNLVEVALEKAVERARLLRENASLRDHLKAGSGPGPAIDLERLGPKMKRLHEDLRRLAVAAVPVLVLGESGTGKEFVARALHDLSPRHERAWLPVNCGALPRDLIESELFGHEKGAFTGATDRKLGLVEVADKGTLFLDEVGELSPEAQVKLLRFIESGEFRRVGGAERLLKVDVRILAATNRDLGLAIKTGRFREDLFFRLSAVTVQVPPLRERPEEVPAFAAHFLGLRGEKEPLSAAVLEALSARSWHGNLRELRNAIDKLILVRGGPASVRPEDVAGIAESPRVFPELPAATPEEEEDEDLSLALLEKKQIAKALERFAWNQTRAAEALGLSTRTLYRKVRELGLSPGVTPRTPREGLRPSDSPREGPG